MRATQNYVSSSIVELEDNGSQSFIVCLPNARAVLSNGRCCVLEQVVALKSVKILSVVVLHPVEVCQRSIEATMNWQLPFEMRATVPLAWRARRRRVVAVAVVAAGTEVRCVE